MASPTRTGSRSERGFTLAGMIVLLTIVMIFVSYTVPRQWSAILQRDRDKQTLFIMRQYAIAISAFQDKHKTWPVSMNQLADARQPRFLRGPKDGYIDPLTGEVDWLIIPHSAVSTPRSVPGVQTGVVPPIPGVPMKDYAGGPFVGVRPSKVGKSFLAFNGSDSYEQWIYTALDYRTERDARVAAAARKWE